MSSRHEPSGNPLLPAALDLYQRSWQRCWRLALAGALAGALVGLYAALRIQQLMASGGALINSALNGSQDVSGLAMFSVSTLATLLTRLQSLAAATLRSPAVWLSYLGAALITLACHGLLIHRQSMLEAESHHSSIMRRPALALLPGMSLAALLLVLGNALASYVADELMVAGPRRVAVGTPAIVAGRDVQRGPGRHRCIEAQLAGSARALVVRIGRHDTAVSAYLDRLLARLADVQSRRAARGHSEGDADSGRSGGRGAVRAAAAASLVAGAVSAAAADGAALTPRRAKKTPLARGGIFANAQVRRERTVNLPQA
jgi:hypothetical protein